MIENINDKIGRWIGNILLFSSILLVLFSYLNLYNNGHKHCFKSDLENNTFLLSCFSYAMIFVIIGIRLSSSKKLNDRIKKIKFNRKLITAFGVIGCLFFMIIYFIAGFEIQKVIEKRIENKIKTQLKMDGVPIKGIVEVSYSKYYGRRSSKIQYDQIEFKYKAGNREFYACYSLKHGMENNLKKGDTLNFIISKSNPEYILLKD